MASASVSCPGSGGSGDSGGSTLAFEDYSLYSNLTDDELLQLAIERSLTETQCSGAAAVQTAAVQTAAVQTAAVQTAAVQTARLQDNVSELTSSSRYQRRTPSSQNPPAAQTSATYSSPNPPTEKPPDLKTFNGTVSRFMTGSGKRMVAYYKNDGSLVHVAPEPEEEEEPLFRAIREGNANKVRALAMCPGTNLMLPSKLGWLAVHQAAWFGQDSCLRMLLSAQPGMVNKTTSRGDTPLLVAVSRVQLGCVQVLLENGADPEIPNYEKETPLYKACERNSAAIVAVLLNHGVAVNTRCIQGWTALQETVVRSNLEICDMLLKAGAKLNLRNMYGITPLFTAAQNGQMAALHFLIKHGADVNTQADDGATALYEAAKMGHQEVVQMLLSLKADANKPGKTGMLPLHIAAQRGSDAYVTLQLTGIKPATSHTS